MSITAVMSPRSPWCLSAIRLAMLAAGAVAASSVQAQGVISGRLLDANGRLIAGAEVSIAAMHVTRQTGRDGRFVLPILPDGQYQLQVRYVGAAPLTQQVLIGGSNVQLGDLRLAKFDSDIERIQIVGQAGASSKALNQQRNAAGIVTVASTDEMGQFPDANASEALQRLAGISVERDQGEGRFVRVRGLAPDYNAVTYNGTQLAAPEAGRRAVALDVIPSDLLESIEVNKTPTPDMPAGSLGGNIDIKSLSAFDRSDDFHSATVEAGYNQLMQQTSPKVSAVMSSIFDVAGNTDAAGLAFAGSYAKRKFGSENIETGGAWQFPAGLSKLQLRDYQISRERLGLALNGDYRPNERQHYYARTLYSRFSDVEERQLLEAKFNNAQAVDTTGGAKLTHSVKQREETQRISALVLGSTQSIGHYDWTLEAGMSRASEDDPFGIAGAKFSQKFKAGVGFTGREQPTIVAPSSAFALDGYKLSEIETASSSTTEHEHNVRMDVSREIATVNAMWQLKAGARVSARKKLADGTTWLITDFKAAGISDVTLASYAGNAPEYALGQFGPTVQSAAIYQLLRSVNTNAFVDAVESTINDFRVDEKTDALYAMATVEQDEWQWTGGVRYERDDRAVSGYKYDASSTQFSTLNSDVHQGYWLPALIGKYQWTDQTQWRLAVSRGLVRPSFEQLAPAFLLEVDDGELQASFGNPSLSALTSDNLDVGIEHYTDAGGVLSAMAFYKRIHDFAFKADLAGTPDYANYSHAVSYLNGDTAALAGLELNAVHQLHGHQNWLDHLLLSSNLTWSHSQADIAWFDKGWQYRSIGLPSQSDLSANAAIGYESDTVSVRLAATYKSAYLQEVGELSDARYDVYSDRHLQWDLSSKYNVNAYVQLYLNLVNLTDEPFYAYSGARQYNNQFEQYGRSVALGVTVSKW